jgi:uncharacterized membrane protein
LEDYAGREDTDNRQQAALHCLFRRNQMQAEPADQESMTQIEDRVVIEKPPGDVFAFYRDFRMLPRFLGDVVAVEPKNENQTLWTIQGPLGVKAHWTAVVTEIAENRHIFYETSSDVLKIRWRVYFSPGATPQQTIVREVMLVPGGKVTEFALALIGKRPAAEVHSNLNRFKQLLETGRATDTSNAVVGKFALP